MVVHSPCYWLLSLGALIFLDSLYQEAAILEGSAGL